MLFRSGSLRHTRQGYLSVLSRSQPLLASQQATPAPSADAASAASQAAQQAPPSGKLFVMELDCAAGLYRDVSVNGLPRFNPPWQTTSDDPLAEAVVTQACAADAALQAATTASRPAEGHG